MTAKNASLDQALHKLLLSLKEKTREVLGDRLAAMVLSGSRARGDSEPDSDIDVLIVHRGGISREEKARLVEECCALCEDKVVVFTYSTEEAWHTWCTPFLENVRREGIEL
ncbi:MAG: nucleotidyltransferase domain-containing protein [Candidatus Eremiobacteraeota bacterium]|nr:nucleotidyltransferase domain-containing protein [Candidatus Eremiobacteraeota bacterium]